jgi:hypothetical protein
VELAQPDVHHASTTLTTLVNKPLQTLNVKHAQPDNHGGLATLTICVYALMVLPLQQRQKRPPHQLPPPLQKQQWPLKQQWHQPQRRHL